MGLPFAPETIESLQKRLPVAFARLWSVEQISKTGDRPGLYREYVFDTEQGIRLIISRESKDGYQMGSGYRDLIPVEKMNNLQLRQHIQHLECSNNEVLHVSGSIDGKYFDHWRQKITEREDAIIAVLAAFKEISGLDETGVAISEISEGGVVHLVYPLNRNQS